MTDRDDSTGEPSAAVERAWEQLGLALADCLSGKAAGAALRSQLIATDAAVRAALDDLSALDAALATCQALAAHLRGIDATLINRTDALSAALESLRPASEGEPQAAEPDPEEELRERVADLMEERARRRKAALASTTFSTEEAAICEWLFSSAGGYSELRERFPHRLEGVSDREIGYTRNVVAIALEALRTNDREALQEIAGLRDKVAGFDGKHAKVRLVVRGIRSWLERIDRDDPAKALGDCRWMALWLAGHDETLAMDVDLCQELTDLALSKTGSTYERGAPALGAWMLWRLGWAATEKSAQNLVKDALKSKR